MTTACSENFFNLVATFAKSLYVPGIIFRIACLFLVSLQCFIIYIVLSNSAISPLLPNQASGYICEIKINKILTKPSVKGVQPVVKHDLLAIWSVPHPFALPSKSFIM